MAQPLSLLDELSWRGLLYQHTEGIGEWLATPRWVYAGFDPTASSLHVGHLLPVMGLLAPSFGLARDDKGLRCRRVDPGSKPCDSTVGLVNTVAGHILNSGGKRIRPLLLGLSARLP